jgi:hypothetical protein
MVRWAPGRRISGRKGRPRKHDSESASLLRTYRMLICDQRGTDTRSYRFTQTMSGSDMTLAEGEVVDGSLGSRPAYKWSQRAAKKE